MAELWVHWEAELNPTTKVGESVGNCSQKEIIYRVQLFVSRLNNNIKLLLTQEDFALLLPLLGSRAPPPLAGCPKYNLRPFLSPS